MALEYPRLSAPQTPGSSKGRGSRKMFWVLAAGGAIGKPVKSQCPKVMNAWKRRQHKMEKALRRPWIDYEHNPSAMQLRGYTLKEFWEIFVDDRPFGAESINRQVNVQSKAVFSYAMTLMDEIRGREDEESWVGSKFAVFMWIYTKEALTGGQILDREQEEYLRRRIMSIKVHKFSPAGGGNFQHGTGFQNRCPVCCIMEPFTVLRAHDFESNLGK